MNTELERMSKGAVVAQFKELSLHFSVDNEENYKTPQPRRSVARLNLESATCRIQTASANLQMCRTRGNTVSCSLIFTLSGRPREDEYGLLFLWDTHNSEH
jgi:hypothetical protein